MSDIDLHIHTTASQDGELAPRQVFELARTSGLRAIAFADHDSVASLDEGVALSGEFGIDFAPAVEITTKLGGHDPHLLGYFIEWRSPRLERTLAWIGGNLVKQADGRVARLRELGFRIEMKQVTEASAGKHPTTAAIITALRADPANARNPVFLRYITGDRADSPVYNFYRDWFCPGKPAFVELDTLTAIEAVKLVHGLGGVAVMAHPGRTPSELIDRLLGAGLDGIEVYCSTHTAEDSARFARYAREHGLLMTAGSDYHGPSIKPDIRFADLAGGDYGMFLALRRRAEERSRAV
jgi:hypothetical protein